MRDYNWAISLYLLAIIESPTRVETVNVFKKIFGNSTKVYFNIGSYVEKFSSRI